MGHAGADFTPCGECPATLTRKLKEAITALKIEAVYSKREILETYLNTVPFLYNAFGIEMAARTYFDSSADQLDVLESATLIGMLKGTSYYNPVQNPERAKQRRNLVLEQMAKNGSLDPARVKTLSKRPLRLDFERQVEAPGPAPHMAQHLRKWLIVRAWVGSRDFAQEQFDHVSQARRQPGSTFKPFVYGAAFMQGMSPSDTFMDQPVAISSPGSEVWTPTDVTPPSYQSTSLRNGLVYSKNTITAQLMQKVGPKRVGELAQAMGVRQSKLDLVPSLALGTSPVTLLEMVSAYGTLANGGSYFAPYLVLRVEDRNGQLLEQFASVAEREPAMPRAQALTLVNVMRGVIDEGTGSAIRYRQPRRPNHCCRTTRSPTS